jgi:predicted DNA-binding transcriptional regulator YafY
MIPPPLLALARAALTGRPVRVAYEEGGPAPAPREVEVLALGWRFGGWVALAGDRVRGALLVLELPRIAAVQPVERRRRPRATAPGARPRRRRASTPDGVDPVEFATADLQDPRAGPVRRLAVTVPRPLASLAGALFAGAQVEVVAAGARVLLEVTDQRAAAQMAASVGAAVE